MSKIKLDFFSDAKLALIQEVHHNWPGLTSQLVNLEGADWPEKLGHIAGYCNIAMDGMYTPAQLEDLTDKLVWKLRGLRKGLTTGRIGVDMDAPGAPLGEKIPVMLPIEPSPLHALKDKETGE